MNNVQSTNVLNTGYYLLEETASFFFFDSLHLDDVVKQLTSTCIFHNQIKLFLSFNDLVELYDLGMANNLKNVNFAGDSFDVSYINYFSFLENLNSNLLVSKYMGAKLDFSKSPFSNRLSKNVLANCLIIERLFNICD
jgi:hypothetical protein